MNPQSEQGGLFNIRVLAAVGGGLLVLLFGLAYFFYGLQPVSFESGSAKVEGALGGEVRFQIVKGEGFRDIGARLSRESLIKSIGVFKMYAVLSGKAQKFHPGVYTLSPSMSVPEIVSAFVAGGKNEVAITVPEGSTLRDIDAILAGAGVIENGALAGYALGTLASRYPFLAQASSFEGFLFPDTYRFHVNTAPDEVIPVFLDNFVKKAWPLLSQKSNWFDYLTLASYLEREVPEFEDRRTVAGILLKRLQLGIPLQVDATISYAKCDGKMRGCDEARVTVDDLSLSSPYNMYQRLGWTPTPIANPGQAAIRAALTPLTSPYLFYLSASGTKETIFSRTFEEHKANRARYL